MSRVARNHPLEIRRDCHWITEFWTHTPAKISKRHNKNCCLFFPSKDFPIGLSCLCENCFCRSETLMKQNFVLELLWSAFGPQIHTYLDANSVLLLSGDVTSIVELDSLGTNEFPRHKSSRSKTKLR